MLDLFDTPLIPGLASRDAFLDPTEEADLIARIDASQLEPFRFQGWMGKRLTRSFGWTYDFDRASFSRSEPIPDWLISLRQRAAAFARLEPEKLVQTLLIRYDPGAGIGWHRDRPVFDQVIGISLGNPATMRFRRRAGVSFDRRALPLPPRSIYHLAGEVRQDWKHSILPVDLPRWSITFRSLR